MTRVMLAAGLMVASATAAYADNMFWVVGSHATSKCEIVTRNPVVDGGNIWFADGPYRSQSDAKLARSTINACPPEKEEPTPQQDSAGK
ncbi:hypothetical protein [Bradyrhizobium sp. ARR65]|uniref:hypothetical protein n=1 Tax=Bradyrhizobium sp. ARR65 TaxID=1040989 RepID=UPI0004639AF1|nr:hypothetical protein [Bradyrhizobium sp. ARR65]